MSKVDVIPGAMEFIAEEEELKRAPVEAAPMDSMPANMEQAIAEVRKKVAHLKDELNYHFSWRKKNHYYVHWMVLCRHINEFFAKPTSESKTRDETTSFDVYARLQLAKSSDALSFKLLQDLLDKAAWNDSQFSGLNSNLKNSRALGDYADFSSPEGDRLQLDIYNELSRLHPCGRIPEDSYAKEIGAPVNPLDRLFWYRFFGYKERVVDTSRFVKALRFHLINVHDVPLPAEYIAEAKTDAQIQKAAQNEEILRVVNKFQSAKAFRQLKQVRKPEVDDAQDSWLESSPNFDMFDVMVRRLCRDTLEAGDVVSHESFARFYAMHGPLGDCYERMSGVFEIPSAFTSEVRPAPWLRLDASRAEAIRLVQNPDVRFVVRRSSNSLYYVLVYHDWKNPRKEPLNCRLMSTERGYMLEGDPRYYDTIRRLVIAVTSEKGIASAAQEQSQAKLWTDTIHRERVIIDEERKAACYRVDSFTELNHFMGVTEPDTFRELEQIILTCSYSPTTRTDYAEIFLLLDTDYSGALDSGEFASGVPPLFGSSARKWAQAQRDHPLIGRLTQDITAAQIPLDSFTMSLADPITKVYLLETQHLRTPEALVKRDAEYKNVEERAWKVKDEVQTWFRAFDIKCRDHAEALLGATEARSEIPRSFAEQTARLLVQFLVHVVFWPFWVIGYWTNVFRPGHYVSLGGILAFPLVAAFYYVPFLSLGVWRYYYNDQYVHDVNVYEIIVPVVVVSLISFVLLPFDSFDRARAQRWVLSKARTAQLIDSFATFRQFLKPTFDRGGDVAVKAAAMRKKNVIANRTKQIVESSAGTKTDKTGVEMTQVPDEPAAESSADGSGSGNGSGGDDEMLNGTATAQQLRQLSALSSQQFWGSRPGFNDFDDEIWQKMVSPLMPEQNRRGWIIVIAVCFAAIHGVLPGIYRAEEDVSDNPLAFPVTGMEPFFGRGWEMQLPTIVHLVYGVIGCLVLSIWMQNAMHWFNQQAMAMTNINHLTSARSASQSKLGWFLPLDNVKCVNFWLLMRERAKEQIDLTIHVVIAAALLFMLALVVAVFVRIIILNTGIDIFAVTALFDILFLVLHLMAIMLAVVKLNGQNRDSSMWLEYQKFRYSMEISQIKADTDNMDPKEIPVLQNNKLKSLTRKLSLVESTMSKIQRLETPVTILGLVVDQAFLVQVFAFVAAGAGAGLAQLINESRQ